MPELASHSLIFATNTHLHLNNVTIDAHPVVENVITNEPSHLMMANTSPLSIANTVISSQPGASGPLQPLVRLESTFIALNVSNHVDDGSLPGAGSGPAQLDSQSRPMAGSPFIDAGTDAHAISALTGEALEFDVEGFGRITGAHVDIGALEVQQFYAINDMYTTPENTSLTVDAPGVLANDTFTGKLKNKAITVVERCARRCRS